MSHLWRLIELEIALLSVYLLLLLTFLAAEGRKAFVCTQLGSSFLGLHFLEAFLDHGLYNPYTAFHCQNVEHCLAFIVCFGIFFLPAIYTPIFVGEHSGDCQCSRMIALDVNSLSLI